MLSIKEIKTFIDNDATSAKKRLAKVGLDYYEANHDIKNYRIFYVDSDGNLKEDKTKSNIRISHPFFSELVDQEVQYMLSGTGGFVRSDNPALQKHLNQYFNASENFTAELYDTLTDCVTKGWAYMYAYRGTDDKTSFQNADSIGVIECDAKETADGMPYVIFWYIDRKNREGKVIKRIQVWNDAETYFFMQVDNGEIQRDDSVEFNPRPHILYKKDDSDDIYYDSFGFIPFFRIDNNRQQTSGLRPIKDLIDDYDLMAAGLSNNIQDAVEALYVVKGFQGDNLDELMLNIKAKKHIGVDEDGDVEIRTIDIPYQARQTKLDLDEKSIYRFGFGLNASGLKDTAATTNIAIKMAYSLLDLKCNKLEIRLKQLFRKLLNVVLKEINEAEETDFQQSDVYFVFEREIPANAQENAQVDLYKAQKQQVAVNTLLNLAERLDNETLMELICDELDISYEEIKTKLPKDSIYEAQEALDSIVDEDGDVS